MNTLSKKQQCKSVRDNAGVWQKIQHWRWHKNHRNARKTTPWDMLDYISGDFVFNLLYMMIYKRYVRYFAFDYHRIYDILYVIKKINPPLKSRELKEKINILFDGIETEEEVLAAFQGFNYRTEIKDDKLIITNLDSDDYCNPAYPEPQEEHILPRYMLRNFLLFRAAVNDCIMGKFPNDLDFWIYTCRYLLMDDKEFKHCGYGPNGQNFPYKNE